MRQIGKGGDFTFRCNLYIHTNVYQSPEYDKHFFLILIFLRVFPFPVCFHPLPSWQFYSPHLSFELISSSNLSCLFPSLPYIHLPLFFSFPQPSPISSYPSSPPPLSPTHRSDALQQRVRGGKACMPSQDPVLPLLLRSFFSLGSSLS